MKLTTITIFFLLISVINIGYTLSRISNNRMGIRYGLVWMLMWLCIGVGSIFPELVDQFAKLAMMKNRLFFVLVVSAFSLFALNFMLMSKLENVQRQLAIIVQQMAIMEYHFKRQQSGNALPTTHHNKA